MNKENDFFDEGYEVPQTNGNYMKLKPGENRFRILSKPIIGWLDWKDNKPLRFRMKEKPNAPIDPAKKIKHFWAVIVWNYNENKIAILELTQTSIQSAIQSLIKDDDWGSPFGYDIKIVKMGELLDTEYTTKPVPHKPASAEIVEQYMDSDINLEALFDGGDPFASNGSQDKF